MGLSPSKPFNVHLYLFYLVDTFITLSMSFLCRPVLVSHHNNPREAGTATNCVIDEDPETGTPEVTFPRSCDQEVAGSRTPDYLAPEHRVSPSARVPLPPLLSENRSHDSSYFLCQLLFIPRSRVYALDSHTVSYIRTFKLRVFKDANVPTERMKRNKK